MFSKPGLLVLHLINFALVKLLYTHIHYVASLGDFVLFCEPVEKKFLPKSNNSVLNIIENKV